MPERLAKTDPDADALVEAVQTTLQEAAESARGCASDEQLEALVCLGIGLFDAIVVVLQAVREGQIQ